MSKSDWSFEFFEMLDFVYFVLLFLTGGTCCIVGLMGAVWLCTQSFNLLLGS